MICPLCEKDIGNTRVAAEHLAREHRDVLCRGRHLFMCPCGQIVSNAWAGVFVNGCDLAIHLDRWAVTNLHQHILESL